MLGVQLIRFSKKLPGHHTKVEHKKVFYMLLECNL